MAHNILQTLAVASTGNTAGSSCLPT